MDVSAERQDGVLSVRVQGRIDGTNIWQIMETVRCATQDGDRAVILGFEQLVYLSSAGLRAMLITAKRMHNRDIGFAICCLTDVVRAAFGTSGFDKIITIHSTRADAFAASGG